MREIKFRVFDKKAKKLLNVDTLCIDEKMFKPCGDDEHSVYSYDNEYYSDVMQYTGLLSKDGVEIYEGDIVRVTNDNDEISELNSDTGVGAIEWLNEWGFWNISRIENSLGDINKNYHIEVVGNIYENTELLN